MRIQGSASELEVRRRIAGEHLAAGCSVAEVARLVGASWSSVKRWKVALERDGPDGLKAKPHPGKPCRLSDEQKIRLVQLLTEGAVASGYATDLWTCPRVAEVIGREFGVNYHPDHVWKILRALGWSPQKPEQRARERDEATIANWRTEDWPRIKKSSPPKSAARIPR